MLLIAFLVLVIVAFYFGYCKGMVDFDTIKMEDDIRTVRLGFGRYQGTWYVRIDLWSVGFRASLNS